MTSDGKEFDVQGVDSGAEKAPARRQRYLLLAAAVWLQIMVVIFIVVQIRDRVHTPTGRWLNKTMMLLGLA